MSNLGLKHHFKAHHEHLTPRDPSASAIPPTMRFALVALIAPLALASPLATPGGSDSGLLSVKQRSDAASAWACTPSYNYCGWYLISQGL